MKPIEIRNGILMLIGFVLYFFIMKALGLYTNVNFRIINIFIHGSIVYWTMKTFRDQQSGPFKYLPTFMAGFRTSIIPVLGFSLIQFLYLQYFNPDFMAYVQENAMLGSMLTPLRASIFLVMEGLGVTIFTSYVGMRYLTVVEKVPPLSKPIDIPESE